jgi:uncharacterized MAPEG superfamily protein
MTRELSVLAFGIVLGFIHIILAAHAASFQRGYRWTASARDDIMPPLTGVAGRLARASRNYLETFVFFAAAVLMANAAGRHNWMTAWGAQLYFWGRVAYLPLYAFGIPLIRSLAWNVATFGIVLVLLGLLSNLG